MTTAAAESPPQEARSRCDWCLESVPVSLIGQAGAWFDVRRDDRSVVIRPNRALARRCTIRPAGLFRQERGFADVSTVMGRLVFGNGAESGQTYTPFSRDPQRELKELFLPVEPMPDDEWPNSPVRWSNAVAVAKRLLAAAEVSWTGLRGEEIDALVNFVHCTEPVECCTLHALSQWLHDRSDCVVEIGSFRGRSLAMLALGLRSAGSDAKIVSIDPHQTQPVNQEQARLTLTQLREDRRMVQFVGGSDEAWKILRPGCASLVFVDGDHSYRQVVADFENYRGLLAPGGCMVFHDYGFGNHAGQADTDPDVRAAVDKFVFPSPEFSPLLLAHTLMAFVKDRG